MKKDDHKRAANFPIHYVHYVGLIHSLAIIRLVS
jgi:hypothetical protein